MRSIDEFDHYEILEIGRQATSREVEQAYRLARAAYAEDSLALYSVFDAREAREIRRRVEEAYEVLAEPQARAQYDLTLPEKRAVDAAGDAERLDAAVQSSPLSPLPFQVSEDVLEEEEAGGEFDGARLRRARLHRGIELDQISDMTKVSPAYLQFLEDENFRDLPADVYVRGFVTAYVKAIGMDPQRVVPCYMSRVQAARQAGGRGRLLGRR